MGPGADGPSLSDLHVGELVIDGPSLAIILGSPLEQVLPLPLPTPPLLLHTLSSALLNRHRGV